jgi:hypothetical protein
MDENPVSNQPNPTPVIEPQTSGTVQGTHPFTPIVQPKPIADTIASPYESLDGDESVSMSTVAASMSTASSATNPQQQTVAPQKEPLKLRDKDTNKLVTRVVAGALVVMLLLFGAGMVSSRLSNNRPVDPVAQLEEQEVASLTDVSSGITVRPSDDTLLVNGSVLATKTLQVINGSTYGSIAFNGETQDRTYTLPDASGVFCLDSNNCGYLQADDVITTTIAGVGGNLAIGQGLAMNGSTLSSTITQTVQTSVNNSIGSITLQGTTNQVTVTQNGNVLSLSGPQDLGITNAPTFASISISGIGTQNGNVICDFSNNCGYSGVNSSFVQGGNSFGLAAVLGTNDNFSLAFETNGATQATLAVGGAFTLQNSTDSTSSFRVMDADGGNPVLNVDTTNERVGIGTAAPAVELDVVGDTVISNRLQIGPTGDDIDQCTTVFFGVLGCDVALDVANTSTGAGGAVYGIYNNTSITPTGTNFATNYGSSNNLFLNGSNNFTSSNIGLSGSAVVANTAGTVSRIVGVDATAAILTTTSTATVTEAIGMQTGVGVFSTVSGGTITTGYGLQVSAASVSGTGASIGTNYGIYVNPQTSGTSDFGVAIGAADTQTLWLSSNADNTTASAGIAFGSSRDTNLYRSAANTLRTDDALSVGDDITVTGDILPSADDTYDLGSNSNRWRDLYLGPATLSIGTSTADYKISYDTGGNALLFNNDQEDRDFRIAGDTQANLLYVDAGNNRIGIGTNTPGYELDVVGTINASTSLYVGGTQVCTIGGCTAASGSGNYIQNGTALQTANFNIQSAGAASVGAIVRGAASQTAALQEWQSSAGTVLARITASGFMQFDSSKGITGTAGDSYLYIGDTARAGASGGKNLYYGSAYYGGYGHEFYGGSATNMIGVMLVTSSQASKIGLTVKGAASQTGNLQEWQNSSGTAISSVSASGAWNLGGTVNIGGITGNAGTLQFFNSGVSLVRSANSGLTINTSGFGYGGGTTITNTASSGVKLTVQGAAGQTANLLEWTNSANTVLASVESTGSLYSPTAPIKLGYGVALQGESSSGGGFVDLIKRGSGNDVYVGSTSRDVIVQGNVYASMTVDGGANGIRLYSTDVTKVGSIGNLGSVSNPWNSLWLQPINATNVAARIRGQAGQSANLQEWQNSSGTILSAIAGDGDIVSTEQISIGNMTPLSGVRLSVYTNTDVKGLVVRGSGSQTANLQEWQNSTGTVLASVSATGAGSFASLTQNGNNVCDISNNCSYAASSGSTSYIQNGTTIQTNANLAIQSASASSVGAVIRGAASQTANLQEWQNSAGTTLTAINSSGLLQMTDLANGAEALSFDLAGWSSSYRLSLRSETTGATWGFHYGDNATSHITLKNGGVDLNVTTRINSTNGLVFAGTGGGFEWRLDNSTARTFKLQADYTNSGPTWPVTIFEANGHTTAASRFFKLYAPTTITSATTAQTTLTLQAMASQTANLQEWKNSSGTVLTSVGSGGNITLASTNGSVNVGTSQAGYVSIGTQADYSAIFSNQAAMCINTVCMGGNGSGVLSVVNHTGAANTGAVYSNTLGANNIASRSNGAVALQIGEYVSNTKAHVGFNIASASTAAALFSTSGTGTTNLAVRAIASQTANLQEWQNSSGTIIASMSVGGDLNLLGGRALYSYGTGDPTTADARWGNFYNNGAATRFLTSGKGAYASAIPDMYFDKYDGTTLTNMMILQSSTGNLGIGTTTIGTNNRLIVNPYSTVDNLATAQVNTNAATNKGLVVQGFASQSANLQEWQNSSGTALARVSASGQLTATGLVSTQSGSANDLYFNRSDTGAVRIKSNWGGATAYGVQIQPSAGSVTSYASGYGVLIGNAFSSSVTSGNYDILRVYDNAFNPTSGNSQLSGININPIINQTGTATGITRGLYVNPTLTSAVDFRGVEIANASGFGLYQSGASAKNYLAGNLGIGTTNPTSAIEIVRGTGGAETKLLDLRSGTTTANTSTTLKFTNSDVTGSNIGSAITSIRTNAVSNGDSDLIFKTSEGFSLLQGMVLKSSGNVGIGETTPLAKLQVTNTTAATVATIIKGASAQSANLQEWQNSSGTVLSSVSSSGAIYAGTSYSFTGDTDTSIYRNGIDQIRMNFGGLDRIQMDNNSVLINNKLAVANSISAGGPTFGTVEKFRVNAPTTIDNSASSILSSSASTDKALVIQGAASQTANIFEVQASNGGVYTSVSNNGLLTSTNITATNTLSLGGGSASTSGAIRLVNTQAINWRNAANGANVYGIAVTSSDVVQLAAPVTTNDSAASVSIGTTAAAKKGLVIQGSAAQSANLQEWQNSSGTALLSIGSTGLISSSATGSEHDFGVSQGARFGSFIRIGSGGGGASAGVVRLFNSHVINWRNAANSANIGITVNGSDTLQLGAAATTPDALSDTTIGTSATTRKGLVIQGLASQTANLQEWQSSTGTVLASISSAGNLTVVNATVNGTLVVNGASTFNGNITVNGQIITGNASGSTTVTVDTAGAGTGATASISGNDTSGVITINTGTGAAAGKLATITFSAAFPSSPNVVITPKAIPGGGAYPQYHYDSATGTFDLSSFNALTDSSTYTFSYFIVD